jgi:hypothetical protein
MMKRFTFRLCMALCLSLAAGAAFSAQLFQLDAKARPQPIPAIDLEWRSLVETFAVPTVTLYRSVDDTLHFAPIVTTKASAYTDYDVAEGHTYFYFAGMPMGGFQSNCASVFLGPRPGRVTGEIQGTVTDSVTGNPIPYARVLFFRPLSPILWIPQVLADSAGRYKAVLDTGTYLILCQPPAWMIMSMSPLPPYRQEWYKDAPDPAHATPVAVAEGTTTRINFDLVRFVPPPFAHIRGMVRDSSGNPLKGAVVAIQRTVQQMIELSAAGDAGISGPGESITIDGLGSLRGVIWKGVTDSTGKYDALVLAGYPYIAMAVKAGFMPQFYDHKSNPAEATIIHVTGDVGNVDFDLNPFRPPHLFSISGIVRDSTGVLVPSRIIVFPLRPRPSTAGVRFGLTDSLGAYTVPRLLPGRYIVLAIPFGKYAPAFYKQNAYGVFRWKEADTVNVQGDVAGIDIGVVRVHCIGIAELSGVVRSGGLGLEGANVLAVNASGEVVGYGLTDDAGRYLMDGIPPGQLALVVDCEGYNGAQQPLTIGVADYYASWDFALDVTTAVTAPPALPAAYALAQNFPNPFNPSTRIRFSLPTVSTVSLNVYNLLGQDVTTLISGVLPAGEQTAVWNGKDASGRSVASGIYFYRLVASAVNGSGDFTAMRKMILLK